ncbi:MAG: hypothetical protein IJ416_01640 [Ruminiclostridium sp.]|nr:hypothetical protein [Ruminiclostridium sp.]
MNNFGKSFKLFFKLGTLNRSLITFICIFMLLGIAMLAVSAFAGEPMGDEEYLASISAVSLGMCLSTMAVTAIYGTQNTRFYHSCPQAECMSTRVQPVVQALFSVILTALAMTLSAIAMKIGILDGNRLSDTLLCCTFATVMCQFASAYTGARGIILLTYLAALPFYITCLSTDIVTNPTLKAIHTHGFGLSLYASVLIYVLALFISLLLSFRLAKSSYKKRSTATMAAPSIIQTQRM